QQYWDDIKSSLLKNKKYTIEKYIDGEEFAFDYFIRDGKLTLLGVNKTYLFSDSFVEKAHLSGTHFNNKTLSRISSKISSIMSRINYFNGALHIELKFDASKDTFKFLEFHPRPGGDFMPLLNKLSSGNDITEHYLSYFSNSKPPKYLTERDTSKKISCYLYYFPIYFSPDAIYDSTWSQHQEDLRNINFDPRSNSLYSHTLAKSSDASKRSVDTLLASFEQIARTLKKQYICSGIRLPLYKKFSHQLTIDQYIRESWEGKIPDPLIDLAKRNGWARGNVIEEYYNDSASLNFGLWVYKRVL
ncbi:MAG: ATP-grasp domain-containing protein, partial [Bacteriovoracaceae bacterium]